MVSKGVDYYGYINQDQFSVAFSGPDVGSTLTKANNFTQQNLQIESGNIPGAGNYTGKYQWTALATGTVASAYNNINSLTGNLEGGTMTVMLQTPSLFTQGSTVCYGFYDAGPGTSGLTDQDQSYVYFTDNMSNWMTYLTTHYQGTAGSKPFYDCVLAGAHDAGMFTLDTVNQILASSEGEAFLAALVLLIPLFGGIAAAEAPTAITNFALTQKDDIIAMLNVGVRYFDFRPGTLYPAFAGFSSARYHQHLMIPGYPYIAFLEDILTWLMANPGEIVVVNCNIQGFASASMIPTPAQLDEDLTTAMTNTNCQGIVAGDASSLGQSLSSLVSSGTRLIFLNQIDGETTKYDSYNSTAYATLVPAPILAALNGMTSAGQDGFTYTVLQLQGTCTNIESVELGTLVTLSQSSSPLMSTKAYFDTATLPWAFNNVYGNLTAASPCRNRPSST
jgi:hypothetical protein